MSRAVRLGRSDACREHLKNPRRLGPMSWMTIFTFLFAFACIATLLLGLVKQWQKARVISAVVAIVSFIMALVSASVKK